MATGVLDEIEIQSQRVINQKKQEVAQLAQYKESLDGEIKKANAELSQLQSEAAKLKDSISRLKSSEASELKKRSDWDKENAQNSSRRHADLVVESQKLDSRKESIDEKEKELTRKENNLKGKVESFSKTLRGFSRITSEEVEKTIASLS